MSVRVVYSDLDGTMVGPWGCFFRAPDETPTTAPAGALVGLLEAGVELVLVSGRTRPQLEEACRIFGADGYVGELGAVLGWDKARQWELQRGAMPEEYAGTLVEVLAAQQTMDRLLARHVGRLELHAPWHEGHAADVMLRGNVDVAATEEWLSAQGLGWLRLRDNGVLPYRDMPDVDGPVHVYHLMADGVTKGTGVAADLARRGLDADAAIAVGDSLSDLEMAPYVGRFFLVANGASAPATRAAADLLGNVTVCSGANGLGWAEAVEWATGAARAQ